LKVFRQVLQKYHRYIVTHILSIFYHRVLQKKFQGKNNPSERKNGIWAPKSVWSCDMCSLSIGSFIRGKEKYTFEGQKGENKTIDQKFL
jgi:hypothetical protein